MKTENEIPEKSGESHEDTETPQVTNKEFNRVITICVIILIILFFLMWKILW